MELDDFRRPWQQQSVAPESASVTEQKLRAILTHPETSPLAQLKRQLVRDRRLLLVVLLLNVLNIINLTKRYDLREARPVLLALVLAMVGYTFWDLNRRLQLVRRMQQHVPDVANQMRRQVEQLRGLLHLHLRVGIGFSAALVLTVLYARRHHVVHSPFTDTIDWPQTLLAVLCLAVLVLLVLIGRHQQRQRYGRHLDQLEAALQELEA